MKRRKRRKKKGEGKRFQRVELIEITQTECKSGKIRIAKRPKAILLASKRKTSNVLVEQIGKANTSIQ